MILRGTPPPLSEILNKQTKASREKQDAFVHLKKFFLYLKRSLWSMYTIDFDLLLKADHFTIIDTFPFSQERLQVHLGGSVG